jgi:hypothetical protein
MAPYPPADQIRRAIDMYLSAAYPNERPAKLETTLHTLATCTGHPLECQVFVHTDSPPRFSLRLGNSFYPHMKLVVEQAPDESLWLYRVDTHDRHVCPKESSPEYAAFCELMSRNQKLAESVEAEWERGDVPTFKHFLREDLKRRMAKD